MVDPILLIAVPLAVAFLLPLIENLGRMATRLAHLATVIFVVIVSGSWLWALGHGAPPAEVHTGGWAPPLGINLRLGTSEAALVFLAGLTAFLSSFVLPERDETRSYKAYILQVLLLTGAIGLITTRDFFNVFVFLEITSIGTYALVALGDERRGLEAGFKYMVLGAIASTFLLLSIALLYKATGTLNLDDMPGKVPGGAMAGAVSVVLALLLVALVAELKLFPLNGPAVDLYDGADPAVMALVVGTSVNAVVYAAYKILAVFPAESAYPVIISAIGMATFVVANLVANRQTRVRRMLGYSSSAQIGLVLFLLPFVQRGQVPLLAVGLLVVNHTFAKAGLLWIAGRIGGETLEEWAGTFTGRPVLRLAFAALLLAITGMPPFVGFFGKWTALVSLTEAGEAWWMAPLLLGSLLELGYYFRWYRAVAEAPSTARDPAPWTLADLAPVAFALLGVAFGAARMQVVSDPGQAVWMLLGGGLVFAFAAERVPSRMLVGSAIVVLGGAGYVFLPAFGLDTLTGLFGALIFAGGAVVLVAALGLEVPPTFAGLFLLLVGGLLMVVGQSTLLAFFVGWEIMTWAAYLMIARGEKGARPAYAYMMFSGAAGFLVLAGVVLAVGAGAETLHGLSGLSGPSQTLVWALLGLGFVVKLAAFGAHVYAPDAYTEAPDAFTPFLSGVVSKIPVFAFALLLAQVVAPAFGASWDGARALAWLGAITAFGMTMLALLQEDAKRLLAYSSVAQVGYIVLGLAVLTPMGWYAALFHTVHHFVFKMLLFVAVAGVVHRTGTRLMFKMGGLIARMPVSFISVLVGIIAMSGVPPLGGYTGKWLLYQALLDKGWLMLLGFTMFASLIAFLYLFRLIHSIFLGQLKARHREIKEAPWPLLVAQAGLVVAILVLGAWPQAILTPIATVIESTLGASYPLVQGAQLVAPGGSFSPLSVMMFVGVLFVLALVLLMVMKPRQTTKVRQLDIVFAGEMPPPPEQIHYAYDFFRPYQRAFSPILKDLPGRVWTQVGLGVNAVAEAGGRFYTGNAQTYVLYAVGFALLLVGLVS